jgi:hypothetical protein
MKVIIQDEGNVEVITDAFKIEVKETDENIQIQILDFDMDRQHHWHIIQCQTIEKKREHSRNILTHVREEIDND